MSSIVCQRCRRVITTSGDGIEVAGKHRHHLVNPGGYEFLIACFGAAPGCVGAGESTTEDSWFPGSAWQRVFCRGCSWHVGWIYRGKAQVFYGLDCARIRELSEQGNSEG